MAGVLNEAKLIGGPQDGSRVRIGSASGLPDTIYVGPKWLGDGASAWSEEPCERFPARYDRSGIVFRFVGYAA